MGWEPTSEIDPRHEAVDRWLAESRELLDRWNSGLIPPREFRDRLDRAMRDAAAAFGPEDEQDLLHEFAVITAGLVSETEGKVAYNLN